MSTDYNGTTPGAIPWNLPEYMAIAAFTAVAWFNIIQLNLSIFLTFKRRRGLYFWSLLVSGYGVCFHSVGFLLKLFEVTNSEILSCTLITIGWWPMVTGQALVLYSRLHLVVKEEKILKAVLAMIIWNAITLHIPTTVLTYGSNLPGYERFLPAFDVMERIQMTVFSLQEFIISTIYLWASFRLLKPVYRRRIRVVMLQLVWVNIVIVLMDAAMLTMEYLGNYAVEATLKSMIYAIKLVLEFAVLNQLMRLANSSQTNQELGGTIAEEQRHSKDLSDEETPRARSQSHIFPRIFPLRHVPTEHRGSATSPQDTKPTRIGSIARKELEPDPPRRPSGILEMRFRDSRGARPSLPNMILDVASETDISPTIINNPAAFIQERKLSRDPMSLDWLTPTNVPPEFVWDNPTPLTSEKRLSGGAPTHLETRPAKSRQSSATSSLSPSHKMGPSIGSNWDLEKGETAVDPQLLRPRRPSVGDWGPEETESPDAETELDGNAILPLCDDDATFKQPTGRVGNDAPPSHSTADMATRGTGTPPPWLSGTAKERSFTNSSQRGDLHAPSRPPLAPMPVHTPDGEGNLEFVTSAI